MQQLDLFGKTKEELAIEFIQEHEPTEGYFVGTSGGKDSTVTMDLVFKAGVKFKAYYSATGIDPPEVVRFLREHYPDVTFKRPRKSFFALIQERGFPTKWRRWCCDELKKFPTKKVPLNHRIMGIRAEESSGRAKRGWIAKFGKQTIYHPIFDWLEWEVWEYIERNDLPYCSLYDEGFSRIGCVVCPFLCQKNLSNLNLHKKRWPKHYVAFEKAMRKLWDTKLRDDIERQERLGIRGETFEWFLWNWYLGFGGH